MRATLGQIELIGTATPNFNTTAFADPPKSVGMMVSLHLYFIDATEYDLDGALEAAA